MGARKTSQTPAIGRIARPVRVVLAAAAFAVSSAAVPAWSLAALAPRSSTVATVATAPAVAAAAAPAGDPAVAETPAPAAKAFQEAQPFTTLQAELMASAQVSGPSENAIVALSRPHVLTTEVADVIVRIRGGAICTGTPITGTTLVVTAAHCVLDDDGEVSDSRTLLRDGVEYTAMSVLVDPGYHDSPGPRLDAAVLVMDQAIPGPSASLGDALPSHGAVTVAGFQPLDTDGSLLRGTRYDNRPHSQGATGGVVQIETAPAGCVDLASDLEIRSTEVKVPCGLIPGASGGGLFVEDHGEIILVGIISTVAADLTYNGITPLAALHELLENPVDYTHKMSGSAATRTNADFGISHAR